MKKQTRFSTWYQANKYKKIAYNKARRQQPHVKYLEYKQEAKKDNRIFEITEAEFMEIVKNPCFYCGTLGKIGMDRKDSSLGYTTKNCVSCCWRCNYMKRHIPVDEFIAHCKKIALLHK